MPVKSELPIPSGLDGTQIRECNNCSRNIVISTGDETWKRIGDCGRDCPYPSVEEMPLHIARMESVRIVYVDKKRR